MESGATGTNPNCDIIASPLIVQLPSVDHQPEPITLGNPADGILFDILGLNSFPYAHAKKLISWLLAGARDSNYFLVLPNHNGQVKGIDQMFGNNTVGPDGEFADNGYEALRKFDGRQVDGSYDNQTRDAFIDGRDPIFSDLRLWADKNGDGVAQANELFTLDQLGVTSIDLTYDDRFQETDVWGNHVKYKTVVMTKDGRLHLMYDLWFQVH
jgi:hypothetical protein